MALLVALPAAALAQSVPQVMSYQGRLTANTPQQSPITAPLPMTFRIYGSPAGADLLWSESWSSVSVNDGVFSVLLGNAGSPIPATLFSGGTARYLEVVINGEALTPRQQIGSVGFASQAQSSADIACTGCVDAGDVATGAVTSEAIATGAVTASALAGGAVGPAAIDSTESYVVGGLTVTGPTTFVGAITENGCADGTVEQRFPGFSESSAYRVMVGCAGAVPFTDRASMCASGWHVCSRTEWQNNYGAVVPQNDYWVKEALYYSGAGSYNCVVNTSVGISCGAGTSMAVCAPGGSCNWKNCGYGTPPATGLYHYFGGCLGTGVAGALCCKGEPQPDVFEFANTAGDDISQDWLAAPWANLAVGPASYLFVEVQKDGGLPAQYCLENAQWYVDTYNAQTPGNGIFTDPSLTKWYRTNPSSAWTTTTSGFANYFGASCAPDDYAWCVAWGLGGVNLFVSPQFVDWGEIYYNGFATSSPSAAHVRIAPTRYLACGF